MKRVPELDGLRGIAAVTVVWFHLALHKWYLLGTAVNFFFVLSGYLITRIILDERDRPGFLRVFYARRALRIFPVYYLALLVLVLTNRYRFHPDPLRGLWRYLTYTQNLEGYWTTIPDDFSKLFLHSWTLAIEEQFYLIWPVLVLAIGRRGVLCVAIPTAIGSVILRSRGLPHSLLAAHCEGLLLGAFLAALFLDREWVEQRRTQISAVCVAAMGFGMVGRWATWGVLRGLWEWMAGSYWIQIPVATEPAALTVTYAGFIGLVVLHSGAWWLAGFRNAQLVYLGTISYGIYLWHPIVMGLILAWHTQVLKIPNTKWLYVLKFVATIVAAMISWHAFEKPILGFKDRFNYGGPTSGAVPRPHFHAGDGRGALSDSTTAARQVNP